MEVLRSEPNVMPSDAALVVGRAPRFKGIGSVRGVLQSESVRSVAGQRVPSAAAMRVCFAQRMRPWTILSHSAKSSRSSVTMASTAPESMCM